MVITMQTLTSALIVLYIMAVGMVFMFAVGGAFSNPGRNRRDSGGYDTGFYGGSGSDAGSWGGWGDGGGHSGGDCGGGGDAGGGCGGDGGGGGH